MKALILIPATFVFVIGFSVFSAESAKSFTTVNASQQQSVDSSRVTKIADSLRKLLAPHGVKVGLGDTKGFRRYKQLQVRWRDSAAAGEDKLLKRPSAGSLSVLRSARKEGTLPSDRSLELSHFQVLVIAVDEDGNLRWWKQMLDPRLVRAELASNSGELAGEELYLQTVDFTIALPDDPAISEVRLFHPVWTGKEFQLELISGISEP